jgi:hypothetical protein
MVQVLWHFRAMVHCTGSGHIDAGHFLFKM